MPAQPARKKTAINGPNRKNLVIFQLYLIAGPTHVKTTCGSPFSVWNSPQRRRGRRGREGKRGTKGFDWCGVESEQRCEAERGLQLDARRSLFAVVWRSHATPAINLTPNLNSFRPLSALCLCGEIPFGVHRN